MKFIFMTFITLNCVLNSNAQMTISSGGSLTINPSGTLFIGTELNIKSNSTGSGYLADQTTNGDVIVTGNITVERYIQANGWHNISIPVATANTSLFSGTDLVFYYDETKIMNDWNFGWIWYQGSLSPTKGYDVFLDASNINIEYTASNSSGLNTGTYSFPISLTDVADGETENHKGWNLIGNPYPSPVDWLEESGWDKSNITDAKYIWNPSADNYTIFLGGSSPIGINGGTQFIPATQGFWVQAINNGSISVNNSARKGIINSTPDYYKSSHFNNPQISLITYSDSLSDETIIRFIETTSDKFDIGYDATKLYSGSMVIPQISTSFSDFEYAINTLPSINDGMKIPLNFFCGTIGSYCIEISEKSNLNYFDKIFIYDKITKDIVDISFSKKYCFDHQTMNAKQRFTLVINPSENDLKSLKLESPFLVYSNYKSIKIKTLSNEIEKADVQLINLLGQSITNISFNGTTANININNGPAYYIVKITTSSGQYTSKIFIQ